MTTRATTPSFAAVRRRFRVIHGGGTAPRKLTGRKKSHASGPAIPTPFWDFTFRGVPYLIRFWVLDGGAAGEAQAALWAATGYGPAHQPPVGSRVRVRRR